MDALGKFIFCVGVGTIVVGLGKLIGLEIDYHKMMNERVEDLKSKNWELRDKNDRLKEQIAKYEKSCN